ncbi:runt-related transcription factor 3-like isoform X2 [Hyalella azteca]|uniref:Runt-related transcription factor 3-like isoform X2 n=1 Tax=Hyalella azteca TaxID=294128 RepID=A0A979FNY8_HYAAZ|nr:runt-related transcription factor 3-like isoform X2 [Hyalella azteca]
MTVSSHHTVMNPSYAHTLYDMTHMGDMVATDSPNIFCTTIPSHWRSNKSLPSNFRVFIFDEVKDGTIVTIRVGNDDNFSGELRNNTASVKDNVAQFNDLRFIGRSGRGKCFSLSLIVNSSPVVMTTLSKAIKITVDGPREPRNKTRQGWYHMPWVGPGGMGYSLGLDAQHAALVDLYRAQGGSLMEMYRLNQMQSFVNAGAAAHMLASPTASVPGPLHGHLPLQVTSPSVSLQAPSSLLQPPPPVSAMQYQQMAAALAGLSETHRSPLMASEGRCRRCSGCDSGLGPCSGRSKSPISLAGLPSNASTTSTRSSNSAASSPPNTPSPPSRTSPSSTTTPRCDGIKLLSNSSPPRMADTARLHPLLRAPFIPTGSSSLLNSSNLSAARSPVRFYGSLQTSTASVEAPVPIAGFSAFSIPKHSPRSVDSSRALQLAAVDSTNSSSPKATAKLPDSSESNRDIAHRIHVEKHRASPPSDPESNDSVTRHAHKEPIKFRSLKASSSRASGHHVWRPY